MNVKVFKVNDEYLVYFFDRRVTIQLNEIGANICEMIYNKGYSKEEIIEVLMKEYKDKTKDEIEKILKDFISELKSELKNTSMNVLEEYPLKSPIGVEIEVTTACNLRCKHCFQGEYIEEYMSFKDFKEIIDILWENDVCEVNLVGGEIFKHPNVLDILKYVSDKGIPQTIVTNATLIDEEVIKFIKKLKRIRFLVSLDGTEELHDQIRGKGQYSLIVPKVLEMKKAEIPVEFLCTLNGLNTPYLKEIVKMSEELDVPISFNLFKPFAENHEYLTLAPEMYFKAVEELLDMRINQNKRVGVSNAGLAAYLAGMPDKNECTATLSGLVINYKKEMITCPYLIECGYYKDVELPLFDENFIETWCKNPIFKQFRENGQKECQVRSLIFSKDVKGYDPYGLEAYKKYKKAEKSKYKIKNRKKNES